MKQNSAKNDAVTQQDLHMLKSDILNALSDMRNGLYNDLRRDLREDLRKDLQENLRNEITALETRLDVKLENMERRIDDRARENNSKILTKFDTWAGSLEKADIFRELMNDKLEDHDKRIKKLEKN